jgi:hypothetical protein
MAGIHGICDAIINTRRGLAQVAARRSKKNLQQMRALPAPHKITRRNEEFERLNFH